ncbi:MAG: dipeptidase [Bacteroidales bacterium]|nr:dipeptidase [Bacteroidales bacterium]MDD3200848.1 dipeptidase [Bacteroidales bacterium]
MNKLKFIMASAMCFAALSFTAQSDAELAAHANALHKSMFTIDTHTDTAIHLSHPKYDENGNYKGQITFPKMKEGGLDAAFFAIYLGQGPCDEVSSKKATQYAVNEINLFKEYVSRHAEEAEIAWCADDFWKIKNKGKSAVLFAIENGYALGKEISNVEMFYKMGVRAITLSHNYNNDICDASRDSVVRWHGLSPYGLQVVKEMNRLGIIVDISHTSTETLFDCIEASAAPIIATHSCVWNLKDHPRNLKDDEIKAIAAKGGVIQVTTGRWALSWLPHAQVNVSTFCDHVDYVKHLVGVEHVGIGTDFDGGGGMNQLEDVTKMKNITIELLRRGWTDEEIKLFWGENVIRVMKEVEKVAHEIQGASAN